MPKFEQKSNANVFLQTVWLDWFSSTQNNIYIVSRKKPPPLIF